MVIVEIILYVLLSLNFLNENMQIMQILAIKQLQIFSSEINEPN